MYKWGSKSLSRMEGVNPLLIECATRALAKSKFDMTIPGMGGLRTTEDQKGIFDRGYSQVDGTKRKSYHQTGNALDVIAVIDGYNNDVAFRDFAKRMFNAWQEMIYQGEARGKLEWGGNWRNFIDKPHWQIIL
ncbi:M15 family metallopeptidase [bacterium]|nr:M15 family metallopeptidase [bacterium]